jgi:TolB protein
MGLRIGLLCFVITTAAIAPQLAGASFPGTNGKIAYVCSLGQATVNHFPQEICTVIPGSKPVRLTRNSVADLNPDFSADGRTIAFEESHQASTCHSPLCANSDIYTIRANGTGLKRITHTRSVSETDPSLAPSGRLIAYAKDLFKGNPKIVVVRVSDGKAVRTLGAGVAPSWSPNGKRIAFAKRDHLWSDGAFSVGDYSIYTMSAGNGSSKTRLTSVTTYADDRSCPPAPEGCPETNSKPDWSPNGRSIAWEIYDSKAENGYIFRMTTGGGSKSSLIPFGAVGLGCPQNPSYSPDKKKLVFSDGVYCNPPGGNPPSIWVRSVAGGAPARVAAGYQPDWGPKP